MSDNVLGVKDVSAGSAKISQELTKVKRDFPNVDVLPNVPGYTACVKSNNRSLFFLYLVNI